MRSMKRPYQIFGVVWMLFSAYFLLASLRLTYYTPLGPGAGYFPSWSSGLIGVLGAIMFYRATFRRSDPMPGDFFAKRVAYLRMGAMTLAIIAFITLMDLLGFRLLMLAFLVVLMIVLGQRNVITTILVSLAGSFGTYYVFVQWLKIPLPVGIFGI